MFFEGIWRIVTSEVMLYREIIFVIMEHVYSILLDILYGQ